MAGMSVSGLSTPQFTVKDSGARESFAGGMQRDTAAGKLRPDLIKDGPMYLRWIIHLTKGAIKYAAKNWMLASGEAERMRFLESGDRHYNCWYWWRMYGLNIEQLPNGPITRDPLTEDHAAGLFFNVNGVEYCEEQRAEVPGPAPVEKELFDRTLLRSVYASAVNELGYDLVNAAWDRIYHGSNCDSLPEDVIEPVVTAIRSLVTPKCPISVWPDKPGEWQPVGATTVYEWTPETDADGFNVLLNKSESNRRVHREWATGYGLREAFSPAREWLHVCSLMESSAAA